MKVRDDPGLTFDDVLLAPKRSSVASRAAVTTNAPLTRRLNLAIPIISANMDTVTEASMAIAIARLGGLGAIHRFMMPARQAAEVARVKRAESHIVEQPATVSPTATVATARSLLESAGIGGLLVVSASGELVGLLTTRDVLFAPDDRAQVSTVMTPRDRLVTGPAGLNLEAAQGLLHEHRVEKLPLLNGAG